jgi:hypothetical protein
VVLTREGTPTERGGKTHSWESITVAVLMDIRDELQALRRLADCYRIPRALDALYGMGVAARRRKKRKARK